MQPITGKKSLKVKKKNGSVFINEIIKNKYLYLLTLPTILFFLVFSYLPMFGIVIAFQDFKPIKGIFGSEFVGFRNFDFFFTSIDWWNVTINTVYLNALFIITGLLTQIILAIMISEIGGKAFKKVSQSFTLLPYFISWPIVAMFSVAFFATDGGFINSTLKALGMAPVHFYEDAGVWPVVLVLLRIWKGTGYGVVIYLAAIAGMDREMYESAKLDGATRLQTIVHITLPGLMDTTILLFLLAVGKIFYGDFGMIYALIGDNSLLFPTTDVIDTFVFRSLREFGDMGMSAAVGLYQSVVGFFMVVVFNLIVRKLNKDAALF